MVTLPKTFPSECCLTYVGNIPLAVSILRYIWGSPSRHCLQELEIGRGCKINYCQRHSSQILDCTQLLLLHYALTMVRGTEMNLKL